MAREGMEPVDCSNVRAALVGSILDSGRRSEGMHPEDTAEFGAHLATCPDCKSAVDDIDRLDRDLRKGFERLTERFPGPGEARIEGTLRSLEGECFEVQLLRRVRRPIRMLLWTAFFGFTLLSCCVLAVVLYKALLPLLYPPW